MSSSRRQITLLVLLYLVMFWSDFLAYRPGMDSMTYGAIARHMALTGEWAVPHYAIQAYSNFFQHPPLGLWMMAVTMKLFSLLFGTSVLTEDWILKPLPALLAGLCSIGVYRFGRRVRDENFAFLATFVLLSSTRFAKYSKGFMLDPFLATFSFFAIYTACLARDSGRTRDLAFLSGLLVTAAFMSKGLFAFAPLAVIGVLFGIDLKDRKDRKDRKDLKDLKTEEWKRLVLYLIGVALPLSAWFLFGDATNYLAHYYSEHVADRIGPHPLNDHFGPMINLARVYWPWLPFFVLGIFRGIRRLGEEGERDESAMLLTALAFIGGFTIVASFLEQYHTATYPFAALVTAMGLPTIDEKIQARIEKGLLAISLGFALYFLVEPYSMQGTEYKNPIRVALKAVNRECRDPAIKRIAISTNVAEIWYALAIGSWNTLWATRSDPATKSPTQFDTQILVAASGEPVAPGWISTSIGAEGLRVYRASSVRCSSD